MRSLLLLLLRAYAMPGLLPLAVNPPLAGQYITAQGRRGFSAVNSEYRTTMATMADHDVVSTGDERLSEFGPWEPLSVVDVSVLGLVGTLQLFALLICVHLLRNRKWPPYVTKNPILVVFAVRENRSGCRARRARALRSVAF